MTSAGEERGTGGGRDRRGEGRVAATASSARGGCAQRACTMDNAAAQLTTFDK